MPQPRRTAGAGSQGVRLHTGDIGYAEMVPFLRQNLAVLIGKGRLTARHLVLAARRAAAKVLAPVLERKRMIQPLCSQERRKPLGAPTAGASGAAFLPGVGQQSPHFTRVTFICTRNFVQRVVQRTCSRLQSDRGLGTPSKAMKKTEIYSVFCFLSTVPAFGTYLLVPTVQTMQVNELQPA